MRWGGDACVALAGGRKLVGPGRGRRKRPHPASTPLPPLRIWGLFSGLSVHFEMSHVIEPTLLVLPAPNHPPLIFPPNLHVPISTNGPPRSGPRLDVAADRHPYK